MGIIVLVLLLGIQVVFHALMAICNAATGGKYREWAVKSFVLAAVSLLLFCIAVTFLYRAATGEMVDPFGIRMLFLGTAVLTVVSICTRPWAPS